MALPVYAQQAAEPAKVAPPTQPSTTASDTSASDNAEAAATAAAIAKANAAAAAAAAGKPTAKLLDAASIAKKAKQTGWRPEVQNGNTVYCRNDAEVGSRFSTRRCVSEIQLANLIEQAEFDKDQLKQRGCGGNCGGK
jgi:hypothetical protein